MKPIRFKGCNTIFGRRQSEYLPLPAWKDKDDKKGEVITCWKLSLLERLAIVFTGRLWFRVHTFHHPLQPQRPMVEYPFEKSNNICVETTTTSDVMDGIDKKLDETFKKVEETFKKANETFKKAGETFKKANDMFK